MEGGLRSRARCSPGWSVGLPVCCSPRFVPAVLCPAADFPPGGSSTHGAQQAPSEILLRAQHRPGCWGFSSGHIGAPEPAGLLSVTPASHTLQSGGPGPVDTSSSLWSLGYQNGAHKFPETPGGARPPLAAPSPEAEVVRDGFTKETELKVGPVCEEGASGANTREERSSQRKQRVQRPCGTRDLAASPRERASFAAGEREAQAGGAGSERWAQAGSRRVLSAAIGRVWDFYSKDAGIP